MSDDSFDSGAPSVFETARKEKDLDETFSKGGFDWQDVIVYSHQYDAFIEVSKDGFPNTKPFIDQCPLDLEKKSLTAKERFELFDLELMEEAPPSRARMFCRVEAGKLTELMKSIFKVGAQ